MSKEELIDAFEAGEFGSVEFFELALEVGMTVAEINIILENAEEEAF